MGSTDNDCQLRPAGAGIERPVLARTAGEALSDFGA